MEQFEAIIDNTFDSIPCSEETMKSISRYIMFRHDPRKKQLLLAELFHNLSKDWKPQDHGMLIYVLSFLKPDFKEHYNTLTILFNEYKRNQPVRSD